MPEQISATVATPTLQRPTDRPDGPRACVQELYDDHAEALRRYVFRLTSDRARAEDVVQETLLRAWRHLTLTDGEQPVRSWLFTVARNIVIDQSRTGRYRNEIVWADTTDIGDRNGPDEVSAALDRMLVTEALSRLPEMHRAVLMRAFYFGWTSAQIADELGIAEGTVKSRLHYALRKLKLIFAEMGVTPGQ